MTLTVPLLYPLCFIHGNHCTRTTLLEMQQQMKPPWWFPAGLGRTEPCGGRRSSARGGQVPEGKSRVPPWLRDVLALGFPHHQADASCPCAVLVPVAGWCAASSGRAGGVENPGEMRQPSSFNVRPCDKGSLHANETRCRWPSACSSQ